MSADQIELKLAEFASNLDLSEVAPSAVDHAKALTIDAFGCALAGGLADETPAIRSAARRLFGVGESTVVGTSDRLTPSGATFVNAYLITAMTVCDVYRPAHCHMTPLVIPPAIIVTEEEDLSGAEFLTAVIAGMETMARVAVGLDYGAFRSRGWHSPGVIGPLGAAAAVGRLRGFDPDVMLHALSLAATQSAGSYLSWGTPAVKFHQARGSLSGLIAADLAGEGFVGGPRPLTDSDGGIYNTHSNGGDPEAALSGLGQTWEMEEIALRLWPGASPVQAMLTAVFELIETEGITPEDTDRVEIGVSTEDFGTHGGFVRPRGTFEALLSYAYLCSASLHDRLLWFDQVRAPRIQDPELLSFAEERVTVTSVDDLPVNGCDVAVTLVDGRQLTRRVEKARGTPENPATKQQVDEKFRRAAATSVDEQQANEVLEFVWDLENQSRLERLWTLLGAG